MNKQVTAESRIEPKPATVKQIQKLTESFRIDFEDFIKNRPLKFKYSFSDTAFEANDNYWYETDKYELKEATPYIMQYLESKGITEQDIIKYDLSYTLNSDIDRAISDSAEASIDAQFYDYLESEFINFINDSGADYYCFLYASPKNGEIEVKCLYEANRIMLGYTKKTVQKIDAYNLIDNVLDNAFRLDYDIYPSYCEKDVIGYFSDYNEIEHEFKLAKEKEKQLFESESNYLYGV